MDRLRASLAAAVLAASTASPALAQTPFATPRLEFAVGVTGAIGLSPPAISGAIRVNFTKAVGGDAAVNLIGSGGTYVLGLHYNIGVRSNRLTPYLSLGVVGTFESESGGGFSETLRSTGDTLVHPAFGYSRASPPLAGAAGGGVRVAIAEGFALEFSGQCWLGPSLEQVPVIITASVVISFGKVR